MRKVPGGLFSTWINESLKPGDTLQVMTPEGRFFVPLEPSAARHYLGIAGGSGITPILSIMKTRARGRAAVALHADLRQPPAALDDVHGRDRGPEEPLPLAPDAAHGVLAGGDRPAAQQRPARSRQDRRVLSARWSTRRAIDHAFVCGPHGVNDEAEAALLAAGVAAEQIHIERFGIPDESRPGPRRRAGARAKATPPTRASRSFATASRARSTSTPRRATSSMPPPPPASRCRSRASRASAAPAAPSCSRARCGWRATSRSRSTRSRPASC